MSWPQQPPNLGTLLAALERRIAMLEQARPGVFAGGDRTGTRSLGTTYTNETGRRLRVLVTVSWTAAAVGAQGSLTGQATAGGALLTQFALTVPVTMTTTSTATGVMFVDPGGQYTASSTVTGAGATTALVSWLELAE